MFANFIANLAETSSNSLRVSQIIQITLQNAESPKEIAKIYGQELGLSAIIVRWLDENPVSFGVRSNLATNALLGILGRLLRLVPQRLQRGRRRGLGLGDEVGDSLDACTMEFPCTICCS